MTALQMWTDLARDMRKGVPNPDDKGLDHTHTWASTYWGGALFCFMADVKIREQTHNKKGLQDALRGILNAGGDIRYDWKLEDAFTLGDRATGVSVLTELYGKMKDQPMAVDLSTMWTQLGIESDGKTVHLNDGAPLAAIRRAITSPDTAKLGLSAGGLRPAAVYAGRSVVSARRTGEP
jgi:predicted metalloprotease with PDZ domain